MIEQQPLDINYNPLTTPTTSGETESNFLSASRFVFSIDTPRFQTLSYHCTQVNIPSVTADEIPLWFRQSKASQTGSNINYTQFQARFIIDETMENYEAIYDWMRGEIFHDDEIRQTPEKHLKSDVSLLVYNNANLAKLKFILIDCFPTQLSTVTFTASNTTINYLYADVEFSLDYFKIQRIS